MREAVTPNFVRVGLAVVITKSDAHKPGSEIDRNMSKIHSARMEDGLDLDRLWNAVTDSVQETISRAKQVPKTAD
ncbi:MAG: hypothetical protein O2983_16060 [Planctomycetota bacterium]|nr:hypothetical protein [Planctomycetota bacterium]MDA0918181.1 hypothetical protein [Planctomycetota bacterium]MDA1161118.1 hypothetical protein [Planctomycetota bacterium]